MDHWELLEKEITACRMCPRLVVWREQMAREKRRAYREWEYWGKPVPGFGDQRARVLVVGLAPGAHGSNRTGRMFTGDASGEFLYSALYRAGFANQGTSIRRGDGLELKDIFISAVCRCAPPDNKPTPGEIRTCLPFLRREMALLSPVKGVVALGRVAFDSMAMIQFRNPTALAFSHGAYYSPDACNPWLLASYHPSRQNTQTGRLTQEMFDCIWQKVKDLLIQSG